VLWTGVHELQEQVKAVHMRLIGMQAGQNRIEEMIK
jgi:hypothetical protein